MRILFVLLAVLVIRSPMAGEIGHGDGEPDHQDDPGTAAVEWLESLFPSDSE